MAFEHQDAFAWEFDLDAFAVASELAAALELAVASELADALVLAAASELAAALVLAAA